MLNNNCEKYPFTSSSSFPVCFESENYFENMMEYYGTIVYQKGSSYLRNLEFLIGAERFRELFVRVLKEYSYKNLSGEQFFEILKALAEDQSHAIEEGSFKNNNETLRTTCEKWFESHINIKGYPILNLKSKKYDEASKILTVEFYAAQAKWTKVRGLLIGSEGQT